MRLICLILFLNFSRLRALIPRKMITVKKTNILELNHGNYGDRMLKTKEVA